MPAHRTCARPMFGNAPTPIASRRKRRCLRTNGGSSACNASTLASGRWPRKSSVRWTRATSLTRTHSWSGASPSIGSWSLARKASGRSIAKKTRQRSGSPSGVAAYLDHEFSVALQRGFPVGDELREPGGRPLRGQKIDRGGKRQDDGQVHLVAPALEHRRDGEAPIGAHDPAVASGR